MEQTICMEEIRITYDKEREKPWRVYYNHVSREEFETPAQVFEFLDGGDYWGKKRT